MYCLYFSNFREETNAEKHIKNEEGILIVELYLQ